VVFEGRSRVEEKAAHHLHESPPVMTMPLVVLAVFAALVGLVGVPPEHGLYHRFVEPVFAAGRGAAPHAAPVGELPMALLSLTIALLGVWVATQFYVRRPETPARLVERHPVMYRILLNKYYVDELYDAVFVRPTVTLANGLWRAIDVLVIDGAVNGVGRVTQAWGALLRVMQSGQLQHYALFMAVGAVLMVGIYLLQ
jgi:NADH-quinone oxidoreductase subunit L